LVPATPVAPSTNEKAVTISPRCTSTSRLLSNLFAVSLPAQGPLAYPRAARTAISIAAPPAPDDTLCGRHTAPRRDTACTLVMRTPPNPVVARATTHSLPSPTPTF